MERVAEHNLVAGVSLPGIRVRNSFDGFQKIRS